MVGGGVGRRERVISPETRRRLLFIREISATNISFYFGTSRSVRSPPPFVSIENVDYYYYYRRRRIFGQFNFESLSLSLPLSPTTNFALLFAIRTNVRWPSRTRRITPSTNCITRHVNVAKLFSFAPTTKRTKSVYARSRNSVRASPRFVYVTARLSTFRGGEWRFEIDRSVYAFYRQGVGATGRVRYTSRSKRPPTIRDRFYVRSGCT